MRATGIEMFTRPFWVPCLALIISLALSGCIIDEDIGKAPGIGVSPNKFALYGANGSDWNDYLVADGTTRQICHQ